MVARPESRHRPGAPCHPWWRGRPRLRVAAASRRDPPLTQILAPGPSAHPYPDCLPRAHSPKPRAQSPLQKKAIPAYSRVFKAIPAYVAEFFPKHPGPILKFREVFRASASWPKRPNRRPSPRSAPEKHSKRHKIKRLTN